MEWYGSVDALSISRALRRACYLEVLEEHHEDEEVVHREGLLHQVPVKRCDSENNNDKTGALGLKPVWLISLLLAAAPHLTKPRTHPE